MRSSKNFKYVIALLEAIIEKGVLRHEQHRAITQARKRLRLALRSRNKREVDHAVSEISKTIVEAFVISDEE